MSGRAPLTQVPVDIGRREAQVRAVLELAKPGYRVRRPSVAQRVVDWVARHLVELLARIGAAAHAHAGVVVALLVLAVASVVLVIVWRTGTPAKSGRGQRPVLPTARRSAAEYRLDAAAHAAAGRLAEAVRDQLRAIVRSLEDRAILDERPGRTADEVAREAGRLLPPLAPGLARAASRFDEVCYGREPAEPADYRALVELDQQLAAQRPTHADEAMQAAGSRG